MVRGRNGNKDGSPEVTGTCVSLVTLVGVSEMGLGCILEAASRGLGDRGSSRERDSLRQFQLEHLSLGEDLDPGVWGICESSL